MCSLYFQLNQQAKSHGAIWNTWIPWYQMQCLLGCLTCSQKLFHVVTCCAHFCRELSRPWRPSTPYDPCFLKPSSSSDDIFSDYVVPHIYMHVQWWCRTLLRKGSKVVDIFGQDPIPWKPWGDLLTEDEPWQSCRDDALRTQGVDVLSDLWIFNTLTYHKRFLAFSFKLQVNRVSSTWVIWGDF